jgi:ligand-binding sensor domain-containing protein/signal transduction histidine kinase
MKLSVKPGGCLWQARVSAAMVAGLCATQLAASAQTIDDSRIGQLAVGRNADGHLEIFKVDSSGELRHRWQKEAGGDWSTWSSLGGSFFAGLSVVTTADGTLEVFAVERASHALKCVRQAASAQGWGAWTSLGERIRAPATVGQNLDGRLEVFAVEAEGSRVRHIWQTNLDGGWSGWEDLGGNLEPGLVVGRNTDGRLEIFGVEAGNQTLTHCCQTVPNGDTHWSGWSSLWGAILPGLALGQNADGRLEIFAVNSRSGAVDHIYQVSSTNGAPWSGWSSLGGNFKGGIAVGQDEDRRLEVFAVSATQTDMSHCWQLEPNDSKRWSLFWGIRGSVEPCPAVGRNLDGSLEIFAVDAKNGMTVDHKRQIGANSDWLDWYSMERHAFPYTARTWQTAEGLPHSVVQAVAQTPDGYLWVGTQGGLARFDGLQFTTFDAKNTPEIKNSFITCLCVDRGGTLWIGTRDGLVRLRDGIFSRQDKSNGLAGGVINVIYERRDGSVWVGTLSGLSRYANGTVRNYTVRDGLVSGVVRALHEDRGTNLWIGTPLGLNCLHKETMQAFTRTNGLPENSIRGITQDNVGIMWIGSDSGMIWHNVAGGFYAYDRRYGLSDSIVSTVCEDRAGNLWVGTYSGLNRFRDGRFFNELNNEGVAYDKVNAIFEDREGNLWLGSKEGLIRLTPKRFFAYGKPEGLAHNNTVSVLEDRTGSLWTGTWGGGLDQLRDERVIGFSKTNGLSLDSVLALCEGRDGSLWVGTDYDGGLNHLKDGKFTHFGSEDGLLKAAIRVIHEDQSGTLWIGTSSGLSCLKNGQFTNCAINAHLAGQVIRVVCEDHAGRLWFGTETNGLCCWANGQFNNFTIRDGLSDNTVIALYEDKAQNLWIGTGAGGLDRMSLLDSPKSKVQSPKSGATSQRPESRIQNPESRTPARITSCTRRQGLFSDEIFEILEDDYGWLWMSCSKGVFRVRKSDLDALDEGKLSLVTSIPYGRADGMKSTLCNGVAKPAGWKARDGRLWFPTTKGLVAVDPNIALNQTPPPIYIEQLLVDKQTVMSDRGCAAGQGTPSAGRAPLISLPPGRGELEFQFSVLEFQAPEAIRCDYILEGVDGEWVSAGTRRAPHYNNVRPGAYLFRVRACNADGVWNEPGASLAVVLLPHYWQTWWFQAAAALAALGAVSGAARYATQKRMQRKLELLEQKHAVESERARIAKDIHDELGSSLTRIMLLGQRTQEDINNPEELAAHAGKIVSSSRATIQSMDEIVWAVDPKKDTLEGLVGYINQFAGEYFEGTKVRCRLEMPEDLPPLMLTAEIRHDLFLVVKEALTNVLKHSHASEVRVRVAEAAGVVEIVVEDNGQGFAVEDIGARKGGNGLENMRKRMGRLGGRFEITSAPGTGARLQMTVAITGKPGQ